MFIPVFGTPWCVDVFFFKIAVMCQALSTVNFSAISTQMVYSETVICKRYFINDLPYVTAKGVEIFFDGTNNTKMKR